MARMRTLKPEFFISEPVAAVCPEARLLFAGLWTQADDEGRLKDRVAALKGALFPYDAHVGLAEIDHWLDELVRQRLIQRYSVDGTRYIAVVNFREHQHPNRPTPSTLPAPPEQVLCERSADSLQAHSQLTAHSLPESSSSGVVEEKTLPAPEANGTVVNLARRDPAGLTAGERASFQAFYREYPRKKEPVAAAKAWKKAMRATTPEHVMTTLRLIKPEWAKRELDKIPYPASWLNGGGWDDQPDTAMNTTGATTARCFTCRKDVAKGGGCTQGEANLEYCDRKEWVTDGQVRRDPHSLRA